MSSIMERRFARWLVALMARPSSDVVPHAAAVIISMALSTIGAVADSNALAATGLTLMAGYGIGYVLGYVRGMVDEVRRPDHERP